MYGLVLEGGGARGAYQIGAHKALLEEGIEITGVAGTSVGALNGAMIIQGDHEKVYDMWHNISYSKIIVANDELIEKAKHRNLDKEDLSLLIEKAKTFLTEKGFDIAPLKEMIIEVLDEDKIRNSGKDFGIVTISLTDLQPVEIFIEDIPKGKLGKYLLASAYLPVFKTEKLDGKYYLDGGFYNNLPINLLKDKGYKDLITVRTNASGHIKKCDLDGLNIINIAPNKDLGRALDFNMELARHNLELGYFDALKALRSLVGFNYYIEPIKASDYFINHLLNLKEDNILKLGKLFNVDENIPHKRALFEFVIPKLSNILKMDKDANYDSVFYTLLETLAEVYKVEKFKIYAYDDLMDMIKQELKLEHTKEAGVLEEIIESMNLLSIFYRDEFIKEVGKLLL